MQPIFRQNWTHEELTVALISTARFRLDGFTFARIYLTTDKLPFSPLFYCLLSPDKGGEGAKVFVQGFWDGFVVDELSLAATFDEAGIGQGFEMMRYRGGCDSLQRHDFSAIHLLSRSDGFENQQARLVT